MSILFQSCAIGVNAATHPRLLPEGSLAMLVNGTVTSGFASPRSPYIQHETAILDSASNVTFARGAVQGYGYYRDERGDAINIAVDGYLFRLSLDTDTLERIGFKRYFSKHSKRVDFCQRGTFHLAQDGVSPPVVIRHKTATQGTHPTKSIPTGNLMAEGWGRLAVARGDKVFFSNHIADPNPEDLPDGISPALAFTEDTAYFLNTRYFRVPKSSGNIIGMAFTPSLNGDGDLGPLAVWCERSTWLYNTRIPREEWGSQDIASNPLPHIGACSASGIAVRGNDVLFSDQAGRIQQMRIAVRRNDDARLKSYDSAVWPIIEHDHKTHLDRRISVHLRERHTLTAIHPEVVYLDDGRHTVRHRAILSLNEAPVIEGIETVWDGVWTGIYPVGMIAAPWRGAETMFIISLDSDGRNRIYRLGVSPGQDIANGIERGQPMLAITRASSDEEPFKLKSAVAASFNIGNASGRVEIKGDFIADGKPAVEWFSKSFDAQVSFAGAFGTPQSIPRVLAPATPDKRDWSFAQMAITITGQATLEEMAIETNKRDAPKNDASDCGIALLPGLACRQLEALDYDLYLAPPFECGTGTGLTAPVLGIPVPVRGRDGERGLSGGRGDDGRDGNDALPEGYELIPNAEETVLLLTFEGRTLGAIELYEVDTP